MSYFLLLNGKQAGPFSLDMLWDMRNKQTIDDRTILLQPDGSWKPFGDLDDFLASQEAQRLLRKPNRLRDFRALGCLAMVLGAIGMAWFGWYADTASNEAPILFLPNQRLFGMIASGVVFLFGGVMIIGTRLEGAIITRVK